MLLYIEFEAKFEIMETPKKIIRLIPSEVLLCVKKLEEQKFQAFLVGGCVRDIHCDATPNDWDITTDALPEQIQKVFADQHNFYENNFGTVTIHFDKPSQENAQNIEITTFRQDFGYADFRHPSKVIFSKDVKEDLARRDFTINAMALRIIWKAKKPVDYTLIDPFDGQTDFQNGIIRAVGTPNIRFTEDALRMIRAIRFAVMLNFAVETETFNAIKKNSALIKNIANERIGEEFRKIILSNYADEGIKLLQESGLLRYIVPELELGVGVSQNKHHIYTIFQHAVMALHFAVEYNYSLDVRLAALLHDIAKPQTKKGNYPDATFYNHDIVGAKIAGQILERLKFPRKTVDKVITLVKNHMFFYDPASVGPAAVRKVLRKVGPENVEELIQLRICDRKGSGVPKAVPYRLRHFMYMVENVSKDPISPKMLAANGNDLQKFLNLAPGPRIGILLDNLLALVIEDPSLNDKDTLVLKAKELNTMTDAQLEKGRETLKVMKEKEEEDLKRSFKI